MTVRATEEIIKRAREIDMARRVENKDVTRLEEIAKHLDILDSKIEMLYQKIEKMSGKPTGTHERIVETLQDWRSTADIARFLKYTQEHVSRRVAELKKMGKLEEKRIGKNIYYRKL